MNLKGLIIGTSCPLSLSKLFYSYTTLSDINNLSTLKQSYYNYNKSISHISLINDISPAKLVTCLKNVELLYIRTLPIYIKSTQFISDKPSDDIGSISSSLQVICNDGSIVSYIFSLNSNSINEINYGDLIRVYIDTETSNSIKNRVSNFPLCNTAYLTSQLMILGTLTSCIFICINLERDKAKRSFLSKDIKEDGLNINEKWKVIDGPFRNPLSITLNSDQSMVCIAYENAVTLFNFKVSKNIEFEVLTSIIWDPFTTIYAKFLLYSNSSFVTARQKETDCHHEVILSLYLHNLSTISNPPVNFLTFAKEECLTSNGKLPYLFSFHPETHLSIKLMLDQPIISVTVHSAINSQYSYILLATQSELILVHANSELFIMKVVSYYTIPSSNNFKLKFLTWNYDGGLIVALDSKSNTLCFDHSLQLLNIVGIPNYTIPCSDVVDSVENPNALVQVDWVTLPPPLRGVDGDYGINTLVLLFKTGTLILMHFSMPSPSLTTSFTDSLLLNSEIGSSASKSLSNLQDNEYSATNNVLSAIVAHGKGGVAVTGPLGGGVVVNNEGEAKNKDKVFADFFNGLGFVDPIRGKHHSVLGMYEDFVEDTGLSISGKSGWVTSSGGLASQTACSSLSALSTFFHFISRQNWNMALKNSEFQMSHFDRQWSLSYLIRFIISSPNLKKEMKDLEIICNEIINFWRYLHTDNTSSLVQSVFSNLGTVKNSKIEHRTQVRWFHNQQKFKNEKLTIINEFQYTLLNFINFLQFNPDNLCICQKFIYKLQAIYPQILPTIVENFKFDITSLQSYFLNYLIHDHNLLAQEKPVEIFPKDAVLLTNTQLALSEDTIPQLASFTLSNPELLLASSYDYETVQKILHTETKEGLASYSPQLILSVGRYFESKGMIEEASSLYKIYSSNGGLTNDFAAELAELQNIQQARLLAFDI